MRLQAWAEALCALSTEGQRVKDWSLYYTENQRLSLGIKDRLAGSAHTPLALAERCSMRYLFVWDDGKVSRGSLERAQLDGAPGEVLSFARAAAFEDPDAAFVRGNAQFPDVELYSQDAADIAIGESDWIASRLEAVRQTVERESALTTWSGSFVAGVAHAHAMSSAGLDAAGRGSSAGWYITFNGQYGDGFSARRADRFDEFEARLARTVEIAAQLGGSTQPVDLAEPWILLHPAVVERYVLDTVLHHLSGSVVAHGEGRFSKGDFVDRRQAFDSSLQLKIDPLQPLRSGSYRFSIEGVPASRGAFITDGKLTQPLLDMKYARRLNLEPGPLIYDADCVEFCCGAPLTLAEARKQTGHGVEILSVLGIHTQDVSSGDFSLSAPQALVYADGQVTGKQKGTLSGNLFERLQDPETTTVTFPGETTPGLLMRCRFEPS